MTYGLIIGREWVGAPNAEVIPPRLGSIRNGETDYRASRAPATTLCCDTREWTMRVHGEDLIHAKAARHDPKRFNYFAKKDGISPE